MQVILINAILLVLGSGERTKEGLVALSPSDIAHIGWTIRSEGQISLLIELHDGTHYVCDRAEFHR